MTYAQALFISILICYPIWRLAQWFKGPVERRRKRRKL